jgi:hypothetical protein
MAQEIYLLIGACLIGAASFGRAMAKLRRPPNALAMERETKYSRKSRRVQSHD